MPELVVASFDPKEMWRQVDSVLENDSSQRPWRYIEPAEPERYSHDSCTFFELFLTEIPGEELDLVFNVSPLSKSSLSQETPEHASGVFEETPFGSKRRSARSDSWLSGIASLFDSSIIRSLVRLRKKEPLVLERLEGFVDQIDGPVAYVTLKSEHGDELVGEYPADELMAKGIRERRRFRCETVESDGAVRVSFHPLEDEPVSDEEQAAIGRRIECLLEGDDLDGDY